MYHFQVTVTLASDLVLEHSCPEHISYNNLCRNFKFGVYIQFGMMKCRVPTLGHCDLDL